MSTIGTKELILAISVLVTAIGTLAAFIASQLNSNNRKDSKIVQAFLDQVRASTDALEKQAVASVEQAKSYAEVADALSATTKALTAQSTAMRRHNRQMQKDHKIMCGTLDSLLCEVKGKTSG